VSGQQLSTSAFFWRLVRHAPGLFAGSSLTWGVYTLSTLVPGLLLQNLFNRLGPSSTDEKVALSVLALVMAVSLGRLFITYPAVRSQVTFQYTVAALLRENLLVNLLWPDRDGASRSAASGELVNHFRDDVDRLAQTPPVAMNLISGALFTVLALIVMARVDFGVTALIVLPLMAVFPVVGLIGRKVRRYRALNRAAATRVTDFLNGVFAAPQLIRVTGSVGPALVRLRSLNADRKRVAVRDETLGAVVPSVTVNISTVAAGLVLMLVADQLREGRFTIGDLALFDAYLYYCIQFAGQLGTFLTQYKQASVSLDRLTEAFGSSRQQLVATDRELLGRNPGVDGPLRSFELRQVSFCYPGSGRGIDAVDLEFAPRSVTVVVGPIGSGKSTLLHSALGLLAAQRGELCWNGRPLTDPADQLRAPRCAYTAQSPQLFTGTIRTNIMIGVSPDEEVLQRALHAAVLDDIDQFANGLDTLIGPRGMRLSGGQAQRVALARSFAREAELCVLDDVSSALDPATEDLLWQRVLGRPERTYLIAAHRPSVLRYATRLVELDQGRVVRAGLVEEVAAASPFVRELLTWHGKSHPVGEAR